MSDSSEFNRALSDVMSAVIKQSDSELHLMKQSDLEKFWHFRWNDSCNIDQNIYEFHDLLGMYGRQCRRWEEIHHGRMCAVERVRDRHLMPKIQEFVQYLATALNIQLQSSQTSCEFYKRRVDALYAWQSKMRDPERTVVCDIIANGFTIEDTHPSRYELTDRISDHQNEIQSLKSRILQLEAEVKFEQENLKHQSKIMAELRAELQRLKAPN